MKYLDWILNTDVQDILSETPDNINTRSVCAPRIWCKDGENVSIQAGKYLHCTPQHNYAPWSEIEAGYPSCKPPESWEKYAEEWDRKFSERIRYVWWNIKHSAEADFQYKPDGNKYINLIRGAIRGAIRGTKRGVPSLFRPQPCNTIYNWIPVKMVREFIKAHGGEDTRKCFEQLKAKGE